MLCCNNKAEVPIIWFVICKNTELLVLLQISFIFINEFMGRDKVLFRKKKKAEKRLTKRQATTTTLLCSLLFFFSRYFDWKVFNYYHTFLQHYSLYHFVSNDLLYTSLTAEVFIRFHCDIVPTFSDPCFSSVRYAIICWGKSAIKSRYVSNYL